MAELPLPCKEAVQDRASRAAQTRANRMLPRALSSNKKGLGFKMAAFEASGSFANLFPCQCFSKGAFLYFSNTSNSSLEISPSSV